MPAKKLIPVRMRECRYLARVDVARRQLLTAELSGFGQDNSMLHFCTI